MRDGTPQEAKPGPSPDQCTLLSDGPLDQAALMGQPGLVAALARQFRKLTAGAASQSKAIFRNAICGTKIPGDACIVKQNSMGIVWWYCTGRNEPHGEKIHLTYVSTQSTIGTIDILSEN